MLIRERQISSRLCRIPPELRLVALVVFSLAAGQANSLKQLAVAGSYGLLIMLFSSRSMGLILRRAIIVELPLLLLPLTMPFSTPGGGPEVMGLVFSLQGLRLSLFIMIRVFMISVVFMTVLSGEHPYMWFSSMGRLGVPRKIVMICRLSYRYIWVISDEYRKLQNAMKVRAFSPHFNMRTYRMLSYLLGMLLVRTHNRSVRVAGAMRLRGFSEKWIEIPNRNLSTNGNLAWGFLLIMGAGGCVLV